jgi:ABC-type proline/glycine betaine transport system substrate-binding protein
MKRNLLFAGILFLVAWGFNSCEALNGDCKHCKQVTYVDGVWDHELDTYEYCGAVLLGIEAEKDIVYLNTRTTWECK